jgi:2-methylisocitrate lyase-like PEP mutase family enzyme
VSIEERASEFKRLHEGPGAFVMPNPWDAGTARILAGIGYQALATTSAGLAYTLGRRDGQSAVSREEALEHSALITAATGLPVNGDLENGFGHDPESVAETIRGAAAAGLVGCSIEDSTSAPGEPIYSLAHAVERIAAGVEAAAALPFPFTLTARAENYLHGRSDLDDTIARLQAYDRAGADVLYAPGLRSGDEIRAVCEAVSKPVNVLAHRGLSMDEIAGAGARRVSVGGALTWVAVNAMAAAAGKMLHDGDFSSLERPTQIKEWLGGDG